MTKWLIPLLLALAVVCAVLFHIVLPLQHGIQINTVDAYYMLRYAEIWPNIPAHDYFFHYPEGQVPMPQMVWPAMIALTAKLFHTDTTTAGAVLPPILFLLTLVPVYITTRTLFKGKLIAAISVFLLAIMPGEILQRTMIGAADYHCLEILLVTTIMMFGILAVKSSKHRIVYSLSAFVFTVIYFASWQGAPAILFIFALFILALFYKRWQVWVVAIFACGAMYLFAPDLFLRLDIFIPDIRSTVSESMPLFFTNGQFDISAMLAYFSVAFFLILFGLGVLIHQYVKSKSRELLLFLTWTIVMLALTFSLKRFAYYSAINIAIITAFFSVYIINIFKSSRKRVLELAATLLLICLVFGFRSTITAMSDYGVMPKGWQECCTWLRGQVDEYGEMTLHWSKADQNWYGLSENTTLRYITREDNSYYIGKDPGYGVLSHWNYGYWIAEAGHMPASYTPGDWFGDDIMCKSDITSDIAKNRWKYIILDEEMFTIYSYSIFYSYSVRPEDTAVYKLFYFEKPTWQSTDGKVKVFETN